MRCARARRFIARRIVGDLTPARLAALESHLRECPDCAAVMVTENRFTDDLATIRDLTPPEIDVMRRVLRKLAALDSPVRDERPRPLTVGLAGLVVAALLLLVVETAPATPSPRAILETVQVFGAFVIGLVIALFTLLSGLAQDLLGILGFVSDVIRITYPVTRIVACMSLIMVTAMIIAIVGRELIAEPRPVSYQGGS
jgi:hypothetical protein